MHFIIESIYKSNDNILGLYTHILKPIVKVELKPEIDNNYHIGLVTDFFFVCDKYCPLTEGFIVQSRTLNSYNIWLRCIF